MAVLNELGFNFLNTEQEVMSLDEYLERAKEDKDLYLSAPERMLRAIGDPVIVDTAKHGELGRIFSNRTIKTYPVFNDFFGMEEVIERIVSYFVHSSQGLEESRQILYLLGPVGGGKSSLAEKLKSLIETQPFYAIKDSPVFDNPLALFPESLADKLNVPERYLKGSVSPWLRKHIKDNLGGDISKLEVVKLYPSQADRIAVTKTEPGDDNNQDISTLVGKLDIRKLEKYAADNPFAYSYSGALCKGNRGVMEFVEMFKAPIKMLHPLLTATQEKNYNPVEEIGAIPFDGIILAHSNESEWDTFKNNKNNEAFIDRVYITEVPYCLRASEEKKILNKLIVNSTLREAPVAPHTLEFLSEFNIMTRLKGSDEGRDTDSTYMKMEVYDGRNVKSKYASAKSVQEYQDLASPQEGFIGFGTRSGYKVLAATFNYDIHEQAANPIHLIICLREYLQAEKLPKDTLVHYGNIIRLLQKKYLEDLQKDIQKSFIDADSNFSQNMFERYIHHAQAWLADEDFRDPNTGHNYDREQLDSEMSKIEKPASISNPKEFRNQVVMFTNQYRADHKGEWPRWDEYEPIARVITDLVFSDIEKILPVLSFEGQASQSDKSAHSRFVQNMNEKGYTDRQIKTVVEWFRKFRNN